jgi:hypothetical protein
MVRRCLALLLTAFACATAGVCIGLAAKDATNDFDKAFGPDLATFRFFFRSRQRALASLADAVAALGPGLPPANTFEQVRVSCSYMCTLGGMGVGRRGRVCDAALLGVVGVTLGEMLAVVGPCQGKAATESMMPSPRLPEGSSGILFPKCMKAVGNCTCS